MVRRRADIVSFLKKAFLLALCVLICVPAALRAEQKQDEDEPQPGKGKGGSDMFMMMAAAMAAAGPAMAQAMEANAKTQAAQTQADAQVQSAQINADNQMSMAKQQYAMQMQNLQNQSDQNNQDNAAALQQSQVAANAAQQKDMVQAQEQATKDNLAQQAMTDQMWLSQKQDQNVTLQSLAQQSAKAEADGGVAGGQSTGTVSVEGQSSSGNITLADALTRPNPGSQQNDGFRGPDLSAIGASLSNASSDPIVGLGQSGPNNNAAVSSPGQPNGLAGLAYSNTGGPSPNGGSSGQPQGSTANLSTRQLRTSALANWQPSGAGVGASPRAILVMRGKLPPAPSLPAQRSKNGALQLQASAVRSAPNHMMRSLLSLAQGGGAVAQALTRALSLNPLPMGSQRNRMLRYSGLDAFMNVVSAHNPQISAPQRLVGPPHAMGSPHAPPLHDQGQGHVGIPQRENRAYRDRWSASLPGAH